MNTPMKNAPKFFKLIVTIFTLSLLLQACVPSNPSPPMPPTPPVVKTYDVQAAIIKLYTTAKTWKLEGSTSGVASPLTGTYSIIPVKDDAIFEIGGIRMSRADISLGLVFNLPDGNHSQASTSSVFFSSESGQIGIIPSDGVMEVFTSMSNFPKTAKVGDLGINALSTTYINYPTNPKASIETSYSWKLQPDADRVLLCVDATAITAATGLKIVTSRCHQLNIDGSIGDYMSLATVNLVNGTSSAGGYTLKSK